MEMKMMCSQEPRLPKIPWDRYSALKTISRLAGCNAAEANELLSIWIRLRWYKISDGERSLVALCMALEKGNKFE